MGFLLAHGEQAVRPLAQAGFRVSLFAESRDIERSLFPGFTDEVLMCLGGEEFRAEIEVLDL